MHGVTAPPFRARSPRTPSAPSTRCSRRCGPRVFLGFTRWGDRHVGLGACGRHASHERAAHAGAALGLFRVDGADGVLQRAAHTGVALEVSLGFTQGAAAAIGPAIPPVTSPSCRTCVHLLQVGVGKSPRLPLPKQSRHKVAGPAWQEQAASLPGALSKHLVPRAQRLRLPVLARGSWMH